MPYVVDNPGGGDCGFYAFAIGLIDNIKKQAESSGTSPLYNQLKRLTDVDVSLEEIKDFTLHRRNTNPKNLDILSKLQIALREIAAETAKQDLLAKIQEEQSSEKTTLVEGTIIFHQFFELVQAYQKTETPNLTTIQKFNELALSQQVQALAKQTAAKLNIALQGKDNFAQINRIENHVVKQAFMQDIYVRHGFKTSSHILKGIDAVKTPGRWGTHTNLKTVAEALNVNFRVNGQTDGMELSTQPTVRLNNIGNAHWTTTVSGRPPISPLEETVERSGNLEQPAKKLKSSYHMMADKLDLDAKKAAVIEEIVELSTPDKKEKVREEVQALLDKADEIHEAAKKAIEKMEAGAELSDEELAAKLQDEAFQQTFKP